MIEISRFTIVLKSGKKIRLTKEEAEELRKELAEFLDKLKQ